VSAEAWDMGDLEPDGVSSVVDFSGAEDDDPDSPRWNRTYQGDWKGYKNGGKAYLGWAELVRRWGPVTPSRGRESASATPPSS